MHAVPLSLSQHYPQHPGQAPPPPQQQFGGGPFGGPHLAPGPHQGAGGEMQDPAQLQQLVQLLGAKMLPKQTAVVECPKSMVGRVIGKGGETIKALQQYTGAMIQVGDVPVPAAEGCAGGPGWLLWVGGGAPARGLSLPPIPAPPLLAPLTLLLPRPATPAPARPQIDQSTDPTRVTIAGSPQSLQLAVSMVNDIVRGTFKGFAMLRQIAISTSQQAALGQYGQPQPVYVQGYGFVPPSQVYNPDEANLATLLRTSPTGPLTPPMTPLRAPPPGPLPGNLPPEALAALLGQNQALAAGLGGMAPPPMPGAPPGAHGERRCCGC